VQSVLPDVPLADGRERASRVDRKQCPRLGTRSDQRAIESKPDDRVLTRRRVAQMGRDQRECAGGIEVIGIHDHERAADRVPRRKHGIGSPPWPSLHRELDRDPGRAHLVEMGPHQLLDRRPNHDHSLLEAGLRRPPHQHVGDRGAVVANRDELLQAAETRAAPGRQHHQARTRHGCIIPNIRATQVRLLGSVRPALE